MRTKLVLIAIALLIFNNAFSQNCNIKLSGKVLDFHDSTPIVEASLYIENLDIYTTTNDQGEFVFNNLCAGKLSILIQHISCNPKRLNINLGKDEFKVITLEHHEEELSEVFLKASIKTEKTSIENTLQKSVIETFSDKSLGDALNTVSGISTLNTGNAIVKPMIHGLHSSRLLIINNNVRMFDQEWGDEHAPNVDINSGGRISVVKGANTLRYGSDAIGGLIIIQPNKYIAQDSLFGSTLSSFNSNGLGGNLNTEIVKTRQNGFYTKFQANYKRFGDFSAANYNLSNSGLESINASLHLGYNTYEKGFDAYYSFVNNTIGIIRAAHVGNINDLVRAINSGEPSFIDDFSHTIDNPKQSIVHHLGKIEAYKRIKDFGKLTVQYDLQYNHRKEYDRRRSSFSDIPAADFRLFTTSLQPNLEIKAIDDVKINTGFLLRYQQNDAGDEDITGISIPLIPDYKRYEAGIYGIIDYNLNETTDLSAGFRYDYVRMDAEKKYKLFDWEQNGYDVLFPEFSTGVIENFEIYTKPQFDFHNFSASLGLTKSLSNDLGLTINYGLASRTPNVSELFSNGLHHSAARIETGSLNLQQEVANKFILAFERKNENFGFSIGPYYKHISDFIQLIPSDGALTTIRGAFVEWKYNQVDARIFGVDIDVNKKINHRFHYKGSISLLQGDNLTDNIPLIHMPATNFSNRISYVNDEFHQLSLSLTQRTIFRQNRFPDYNFFTFNPIIQEDVFVNIGETPPTYSLCGLETSAVFKGFKNSTIKIAFNVENLFNVSYREHLNRLRFFADDLGRNINLKIKINY